MPNRLVPLYTARFVPPPGPTITMADVGRRLFAGMVHAALPQPSEMQFGPDRVVVTVRKVDELWAWVGWLGAAAAGSTVYNSPDPGQLVRATLFRLRWFGYVIDVRHLHQFPDDLSAVA